MDHPARYALVELENVHDPALDFEPIHRVLFDVKGDLTTALGKYFGNNFRLERANTMQDLIDQVNTKKQDSQMIGVIQASGLSVLSLTQPAANLAVGNLQSFLDAWLHEGQIEKIDYVHGDNVVAELGAQPGNLGFLLPGMAKNDLFRTVILDGALPRKTFSMGEAHEKRFYMECRRII
jgi:hypothetical protein